MPMMTGVTPWLWWALMAGLLTLLWISVLLLARTLLPGRPRDPDEAIGELTVRLARGDIDITAEEFEHQRRLVIEAFRR